MAGAASASVIVALAIKPGQPGYATTFGVIALTVLAAAFSPSLWMWRFARLLAAADLAVAGTFVTLVLAQATSRPAQPDDATFVAFLLGVLGTATVAAWTAEVRITRHSDQQAAAQHAELLTAVTTPRRASAPAKPARFVAAVALGMIVGHGITRHRQSTPDLRL